MGRLKINTSKEELEDMYGPRKMSLSDICEHYGCDAKYIDHLFRYLGIDRKSLKDKYPRSKEKIKLPFDEIEHMYVNLEMNSADIGRHFGVDAGVVLRRLRSNGVKVRHHNDTKRGKTARNRVKIDDEAVIEEYGKKFQSVQSVADKFGVTRGVISRVLEENNVDRKPMGECRDFWGEKSPNWNSDLTDEERANRRDMYMQSVWRDKVYAKDDYKCVKCGHSGNLNAHHILGHSEHPDVRWDLSNGATLCKPCHIEFHSKYGLKGFGRSDLDEFLGVKHGE